ncbi:hypothetical protein M5689_006729 [Euphorbia peplus]|nr:hypothetical protein M5689_006729 [Euphorbia peplus]
MTREEFDARQEARDRRIEASFDEMRRANEENATRWRNRQQEKHKIETRINHLADEVNRIPDRCNEIFAKNVNSHVVADNSKESDSQRDPYRPPLSREKNLRFNERGDRRSEPFTLPAGLPHLKSHADGYGDNNTRNSGG